MYKNQSASVTYGEQTIPVYTASGNKSNNNNDMQLLTRNAFFNLTKHALKQQTKLTPLIGSSSTETRTNAKQSGNAVPVKNYSSDSSSSDESKGPKLLRYPALKLEDTLKKFLYTAKPLLTHSEYEAAEEYCYDFNRGEGEILQRFLEDAAYNEYNWLAPRWLQHAYMRYRDPVTVYSSPGMTFPKQEFEDEEDFLLYAGRVVYSLLKYKQMIDCNDIPVAKMGNNILDNSQFGRVFGTCRIPIYYEDTLKFYPQSKHIVVIYKNHFYKLKVYDSMGVPLHPDVLVKHFKKIMESEPEKGTPFGMLTTDNRDRWASAYEHLSRPIGNRESLNDIEQCLFTLSLDEHVEADKEKFYSVLSDQLIHGGGSHCNSGNRWMDKTIQVIVNPNGMSGFCYEHSPAEGQPIAMMTDYVTKNLHNEEHYADAADNDGYIPKKLKLTSSKCVDSHLSNARNSIDRLSHNLHMNVLRYTGYGKNFLKLQKMSPDSFIQMALQYAFYKMYGKPTAQYETAHLRIFKDGRTETIRSCSVESVAFARAMCEDNYSVEERVNLLREAVKGHREYTVNALQGRGVDRHLLGLKCMAEEKGRPIPDFFKTAAVTKTTNFRMSTSQVATKNFAFMCYGPSATDGYSCCYNPRDDDMIFAIGSWNDCMETNSDTFALVLTKSLNNLRDILCEAGEKPKAKL